LKTIVVGCPTEVSFADRADVDKIDKNLRILKQSLFEQYGGLDIVFSGDLRQLDPCGNGKKPLFEDESEQFQGAINTFLELLGMHRFKHDMDWGWMLYRIRDGEARPEDIQMINKRQVKNGKVVEDGSEIPENIKYATYFNRDRDAINAALFEKRCETLHDATADDDTQQSVLQDTLIVFSDDIKVRASDKTYKTFKDHHLIWENCGENDCEPPRNKGRVDPVLKLYTGCRIMLTVNRDVLQGEANGTQATVEKVILNDNTLRQAMCKHLSCDT